jgi:beta-lactamase regulating signal transducer with metallopeptidase domain
MITYIIKSSLSLIVMFGLYWLILRHEKLFFFNRVFLIFSIIFSLALPFVSIPVSIQDNEAHGRILTTFNSALPVYSSEQNTLSSPAYQSFTETEPILSPITDRINYSQILLLLYITGVLLLLVRFLRNIFFICRQMQKSEKITYSGQKLVLTDNQINPFCFFHIIFVSKHDYLNNVIAEELLSHELEHIRQSHSIDVIFIELIKIIYWFNPILILYSRAIRTNHEYLADNGVIRSSSDIKDYADKLINYISCKRNVPLTSGFSQSLTRKRLIMLTKSRSRMINYVARIFITLNLVAALLLVLSFTPSYSNTITIGQNMIAFSDEKSEKVIEVDTSQLRKVTVNTEIKKTESGINLNQTKTDPQKNEKLIIVDGLVYTEKLDDIPINSIQDFRVLGTIQATDKYGEKGRNGVIEITTKGKASVPTDIETTEMPNAEPQVNVEGVAAATNMNVLYLGISNPIEIAVPGVTSDKVSATITNGTINKATTGWNVKPLTFNDLVLTILVDNKKVNEKKFRVKPIPVPVAVFAGKNNGSLSKNDVLLTGTLEAELKDFLWDLKFEIESYTFFFSSDGYDKQITSKGNKLTDEMNSIISNLKRGQHIIFKDIKAIGPDGKPYDLNPVILKID